MVLMEALAAHGRRAQLLPGPRAARIDDGDRHPAAVGDPARAPRRLRAGPGDGRHDRLALEVAAAETGNTGWTLDTPLRVRALGADGLDRGVRGRGSGARAGRRAGRSDAALDDGRHAVEPAVAQPVLLGRQPALPGGRRHRASTWSARTSGSTPASNCCSTPRPPPPTRRCANWSPSRPLWSPPTRCRTSALTLITLAAPTTADHDLRSPRSPATSFRPFRARAERAVHDPGGRRGRRPRRSSSGSPRARRPTIPCPSIATA